MQAKISSVHSAPKGKCVPTLTLLCETEEEFTMASLYLDVYKNGGAVSFGLIGPQKNIDKGEVNGKKS